MWKFNHGRTPQQVCMWGESTLSRVDCRIGVIETVVAEWLLRGAGWGEMRKSPHSIHLSANSAAGNRQRGLFFGIFQKKGILTVGHADSVKGEW